MCNSTLSLPVLLQDIIVQVIEYHRADPRSDYGHVFLFVSPANAHEHATRVQNNHNPGFRGSSVQLLPSMVRRYIPGQRVNKYIYSVFSSQATVCQLVPL